MRKLIITEDEKRQIIKLHQFKNFILEVSEHSENLFKSWANKKSGNPELGLSLMNDFFNFQKQLPKKDFLQYKTAEELKTDIDKLKSQPKKPEEDADVIYKDNNLLVVATKTWEAGCKYGSGTKWCTSSKDTPSYWQRHNSSGTEFIWIFKNLPQNNPLHKVSLHFKEDSVRSGRDYDWCTAINDCGDKNPYDKKIEIPNFEEILKKCQDYHFDKFEDKIKDREERRENISSLPIYIRSIDYLNNTLHNFSNNDYIFEYITQRIYSSIEDSLNDLTVDEINDISTYINIVCGEWLSDSQNDQNLIDNINQAITSYIFDTINRDPYISTQTLTGDIEAEISEMLMEYGGVDDIFDLVNNYIEDNYDIEISY